MKKLTKAQIYRLRKKAREITDSLGYEKNQRDLILENVKNMTDELKVIFNKIPDKEISAYDFKSVFEKFDQSNTDWKAMAMSYKPSKSVIKKFTKKSKVERLMTYEIVND